MLRQTIWLHLKTLCNSGVTVILTTHYIEEARNANVVAFMRNGTILAEDEPNILLKKYFSSTLEEVFLKLCDSEDVRKNKSFVIEIQNNCYENEIIDETIEAKGKPSEPMGYVVNKQPNKLNNSHIAGHFGDNNNNDKEFKRTKFAIKVSALSIKNAKRLTRNWIQLIFFILLPTIEFALLLFSVGSGPTDLKLAIFNAELNSNVTTGWGQLFVNSIDNNVFNLKQFNSFEESMDSVKSGQTYAVIEINERFTKTLRLRALYGSNADEETLEESQIRVHIDWTNQLIGLQIERHLYKAIMKFGEEVAKQTDTDFNSIKIPLSFEDPVYGKRSESLRDFILPSTFIIVFYYGITIVSANLVLEEQKDGTLERSLMAGITSLDFLLSQLCTEFVVVSLQLLFMISIPFLVLSKPITITNMLIIPLVLSQGFCGVAFGLFVAVICREVLYSSMFVLASTIISLVMSGVFWPIENMPYILQFCGQFTPNTIPIQSLRYILYREWTLAYYEVFMGFVVTYVSYGSHSSS